MHDKYFPPIEEVARLLGRVCSANVSIHSFALPHDLRDYFAGIGWCRPELYLDATVRSCISGFAVAAQDLVDKGVKLLESDLQSGVWDAKYGLLRKQSSCDLGYRFVVSG